MENIRKLIPIAIGNFKGVTAVEWFITETPYEWSRDYVLAGIRMLPSLVSFRLDLKYVENITSILKLDSLPPLEKLMIRTIHRSVMADHKIHGIPELLTKSSYKLLTLGIEMDDGEAGYSRLAILVDPFLQNVPPLHITHLTLTGYFIWLNGTISPHLRCLVSLAIKNSEGSQTRNERKGKPYGSIPLAEDDIWVGLEREKIHLRHISLDHPNENFRRYLKSYSGFKSLVITKFPYQVSQPEADRLGVDFYSRNTPATHAATLEYFTITSCCRKTVDWPGDYWQWSFGDNNTHFFQALENMRYLTIPVRCYLDDLVGHLGPQKHEHRILQGLLQYRPSRHSMNPVHLIMKTASMLPKL